MRPTILQILPSLDYGGVERGTVELAKELVKKNYRSIVISSNGRLVPELLASGSEHVDLAVGKKSIACLKLISILSKIFKEKNVNIVHARSRLPAWLTYFALKSIEPEKRPNFITTVHGPYSVNRYSKIMMTGIRIIAVSKFIKEYIIENYADVDQRKIEIIPRGVNSEDFPFDYRPTELWKENWYRQFPETNEKFLITLPARITRWKGQNDFIEIITNLSKKNISVHGLIVGGVDKRKKRYLEELRSLVKKNNIQEHITFVGYRDDIKEIMSISNLVLSLAKIPEAFGRTSLEALNLGIPVIAYNHGGAKEILEKMFPSGQVEPLNIESASMLIEKFYLSTPKVKNNNVFTLNNMLNKTISIYNSLQK